MYTGRRPPVADSVCEYEVPCIPDGREVVIILTPALMAMLNACVAFAWAASVTWRVTPNGLPVVVVGVPLRIPVLGASAIPAGSVPEATDQVYGVSAGRRQRL